MSLSMNRLTRFFALIALIALPLAAAQTAGVPPIIDRDLIFGDPEVAGARRSMKNGHYSVLRAIECSYRMRSQLRTLQSPNWNHAAN